MWKKQIDPSSPSSPTATLLIFRLPPLLLSWGNLTNTPGESNVRLRASATQIASQAWAKEQENGDDLCSVLLARTAAKHDVPRTKGSCSVSRAGCGSQRGGMKSRGGTRKSPIFDHFSHPTAHHRHTTSSSSPLPSTYTHRRRWEEGKKNRPGSSSSSSLSLSLWATTPGCSVVGISPPWDYFPIFGFFDLFTRPPPRSRPSPRKPEKNRVGVSAAISSWSCRERRRRRRLKKEPEGICDQVV